MVKVIVIAGEPGVGKTTLVKNTFSPEKMPQQFCYGLFKGHTDGKVYIGGLYEPHVLFSGTDKLSMAVQPHALAFLRQAKAKDWVVIVEGDRLSNSRFLTHLASMGIDTHLVVLRAPNEVLGLRRDSRGSTQNPTFLKGRQTKVQNLLNDAKSMQGVTVHVWWNESPDSLEIHSSGLLELTRPPAEI